MTTKNFVVYRSSAGSGKTFTLVKEYLVLALRASDPEYYRHILAITFTNKAANEMKVRVLDGLSEFSRGDLSGTMGLTLIEELGISAEELQERSLKVLRHMLHNYALVSISTIDGFVHRLIRGFANEMGLAFDFEASVDTISFLAESVDRLLDLAGERDDLTGILRSFIEAQMEEEKNWDIREKLVEFTKELLNESSQVPMESLRETSLETFLRVQKYCVKQVRKHESELKSVATDFLVQADSHGLVAGDFSGGRILDKFGKHAAGDKKPMTDPQAILVIEGPWYKKSLDENRKAFLDDVQQQLQPLLLRLKANVEAHKMYIFHQAVLRHLLSGALLTELDHSAQELREEENILLVSDFHRLVASVIGDNPAPFIYERIGERYCHYLIDEFQDTSMLQWKNFLPLIDNALAGGNFSMVVGDGKQAIYRWRNGDVRQFNMLPKTPWSEENPFIEQTLRSQYREKLLDTNYRSTKEIIDFNNRLFGILSPSLGEHSSLYDNHAQKVFSEDKGLVSIIPSIKIKGEINPTVGLVYDAVMESLEDGFSPSDLAILVRTKREGVRIARRLLAENLPVLTEDSLTLGGNEHVRLLVSVLLREESDAELDVTIVKALGQDLIKDSFFKLMKDYSEPSKFGRKLDIDRLLRDKFGPFPETEGELSLYSRLEHWLSYFRFDAVDVFIETLMNETHRLSQNGATLAQFADWWEEKGKAMIVPIKAQSGIQIMTIHKSKGLQFPVVIYPMSLSSGTNPNIWVSTQDELELPYAYMGYSSDLVKFFGNEFEEERGLMMVDAVNMQYVALTRPEKRLYCVFETNKNAPKSDSIKGLIDSAFKEMFGARVSERQDIGSRSKVKLKEKKKDDHLIENIACGPMTRATTIVTGAAKQPSAVLHPREYGEIVHGILEKLPESGPAVLVDQLQDDGTLSIEMAKDMVTDIERLIAHPDMKRWYSRGTALSEADLVDKNGGLHRPDRVVFFDDHIEVVDFKTGEPSESHHKQVREYVNLISEIETLPVTGFIFYTSSLESVKI